VKLKNTIAALGACAAEQLSTARQLERDSDISVELNDPMQDDMREWAGEYRVFAGACIAAINHLRGVSPE
jgi:hypothetical protein